MTQVTADTQLYAWVANASGYTLLDAIMGTQDPQAYVDSCSGDEARDVAELCEWINSTQFAPGCEGAFFLSEQDAEDWLDDQDARPMGCDSIEGFTPRGIHREILDSVQRMG